MKVLLLGFVRITHMPYMYDYTSLLSTSSELHLISWNRNGRPDAPVPDCITKSFVFNDHVEDSDSVRSKFPHFLRFRKYVLGILDSELYDFVIVLHSTPGIVILDQLIKQYRGRYILDYRDVSHENLGFYRQLILALSRNAGLVLASSPAYLRYLANEKGVLLKHNLLNSTYRYDLFDRSKSTPIRVRYWGMIRHEKSNIAMIDALGGDPRFELHYHGREEEVAKRLVLHAKERGYPNVFFHGAYYAVERAAFAAETDLVHNVYENDFVTIGAMGNKYYDAVQYGIPQICTKGSLMGEKVEAGGLGCSVDYDSECLANSIADYFESFDRKKFAIACSTELAAVCSENDKTNGAICAYLGCC